MKRFTRVALTAGLAVMAMVGLTGPAYADTSLSWSAFPNVSTEDTIRLYETPNAVAAGSMQVCLHSAGDVTWWKGIEARGFNNGKLNEVHTQDTNHGANCTTFSLQNVSYVELMKAKAFGIHTDMYKLSGPVLSQRSGYSITFDWIKHT